GPPLPRDGQQARIEGLLESLDRLRVGDPEVSVLALAEAVPSHVDRAAEQLVAWVHRPKVPGLLVREQFGQKRTAVLVDLVGDAVPVAGVDSVLPDVGGGVLHAARASMFRSVALAARPPM